MSINISNAELQLIGRLDLTYDLTRLGNRQFAALIRGLKSGIVKGHSVVNKIVMGLRSNYELGYVHMYAWGIDWRNLQPGEHEFLMTALTTYRLQGRTFEDYHRRQLEDIKVGRPCGWLSLYGPKPSVVSLDPSLYLRTTPEYLALVDDIESRKVTTYTKEVVA